MTVPVSEIQKLAPTALIELFQLDYTALGGTTVYFHAGTNQLAANVVWQGVTYTARPVAATGFEKSGQGTLPQPQFTCSNIDGAIGALCKAFEDLVGAKVTRKRTFLKYLDAVNFPGGVNPTADPTAAYNDEIWSVNRKAGEDFIAVVFELASAADVAGVQIPRRQCIANICQWLAIGGYRGPFCGYAGGAVADANDEATSDLAQDACGGRVNSCKLRFGEFAQLPWGGFAGTGLAR